MTPEPGGALAAAPAGRMPRKHLWMLHRVISRGDTGAGAAIVVLRGSFTAADRWRSVTPDITPPGGRHGWVRATLRRWQDNHAARRDLRRCASLDSRFASDVGLTHGDIAMAVRTGFSAATVQLDRLGRYP
ncbi:MAG TPA: hypothetical protein VMB34_29675 [Acetobacteraceae bacterium]|nr:hypothetical protein [Acetobacteraceae bacterium]